MLIKVEGGVVTLLTDLKVRAIVNNIVFTNHNKVNGQVPIGAQGTMTLEKIPYSKDFTTGNLLYYRDGNNNNNSNLSVTNMVGPNKYQVTRTA